MDPMAEEWKDKGNKCMKEEKYIEAMLNYTQALKIDPDNPTYYSNRSVAFLKIQQYFLALMDADEVIKRMPKWTKGHYRKAEVQMATEHYEEAVQSYKNALETDPKDVSLKTSLEKATLLWKQQRKKESRLPWLGGLFGIFVAILVVVADEAIAQDKAILQGDILRFAVVTIVTMICYGFGVFYKYFLQSQRCGLMEAPLDLFQTDNKDEKASETPQQGPPQSKPSQPAKSDKPRQRRKGRS